MATFSANGFEIDEDNPQVPLIALMTAVDYVRDRATTPHAHWVISEVMDRLGIPMHILAETDQHLHG